MSLLMEELGLMIPNYSPKLDPSFHSMNSLIEWTIPDEEVKKMRLLYEQVCCKRKKKWKIINHKTDIKKAKYNKNKAERIKLLKNEGTISLRLKQNDTAILKNEPQSLNETLIKQEINNETDNKTLLDNSFDQVIKEEIISF